MQRQAPPAADPLERWNDALTTLQLLQLDPQGFGGVCLRAPHGPVRERWLGALATLGLNCVKVPGSVDSERLLGGIDLALTLQTGRLHTQAGLLQQADQGLVCLPMAERLSPSLLAPLVQALEQGQVPPTRHSAAATPTRFGVLALDESLPDEPGVGAALPERLGVWLDLHDLSPSDIHADWRQSAEADPLPVRLSPRALARAREQQPQVQASDAQVQALCAAALGLGIASLRVPSLALRVACGHAALHGRSVLADDDLGFAARCVLAPRATQWPTEPAEAETVDETPPPEPPEPPEPTEAAEPPQPPPQPEEAPENSSESHTDDEPGPPPEPSSEDLQEMMVAAALASLPPHMLDALMTRPGAASQNTSGRSGQTRAGAQRGRPLPPRPGRPGGQARLHVLATLRAAAPKQRLRPAQRHGGVAIRAEDFHIQRFQQRASSCLILALDASGSAALQRLAEAKGAVELLLQQSYARRDSVCIVAFRGAQAQLLLPATRSLVRAKRAMTGLPGGGGTPLALALKLAHEQAAQLQRQGVTPILVVLSDGRANVTLQGLGGRAQAHTDAQNWGKQWRLSGHRALWIDTSVQPDAQAQQLAATMGASYLPMPQVQAQRMAQAMARVRSPSA